MGRGKAACVGRRPSAFWDARREKASLPPDRDSQTPSGKYYGQVSDFVHKARNPGSKERKQRRTTVFATVEEAVEAYEEIKAAMTSEFDAIVLDRVAKNPYTRDLERGPDDASDATPRRAYWRCSQNTSFEPKRMVAIKAGEVRVSMGCSLRALPSRQRDDVENGQRDDERGAGVRRPRSRLSPDRDLQTSSGKYYGKVSDSVHAARNPGSKSKQRHTPVFATVEEAVKARDEMKATMQSEFDAIILDRVANDPLVRDLEEGPDDASDATPRRAYWRCNFRT